MGIDLGEEERLIRKTARDFARKDIAAVAEQANREGIFQDHIYRRLGELGFMGMTIPEEYGGADFGTLCLALALEEISRVCPATAVAVTVHNSLANYTIYTWGSEELKRRFLPRMTSGEAIGVYALTEPNAGSDVAAVSMSAVRDGGDWVLNGTKIFISTGDRAGVIIVIARTDPDERTRGLSAFVVEPDSPGFSVGKHEHKLGLKASTTVELVFEDCRVPVENLIGEEGMGMQIALGSLDGGRIGIAAQSLGIARAALDEAVFFARERQQFGRRIIDFQATQMKIADMATNIDAARLLIYRVARLRDARRPCGKEASMAKLFASRIANEAVYDSLQIHGGVGFTWEYDVHLHFKRARSGEHLLGSPAYHRERIARQILSPIRHGVTESTEK